VPGQLGFQRLPQVFQRQQVPYAFEPPRHFLELRVQLLAACLSPDLERSAPRLADVVREAEEVEGLGLAPFRLRIPFGIPAELDAPRLLLRQFEPEFAEPFPQPGEYALRVVLVLHADDEVVRIPHHPDVSPALLLDLPLHPEVERVVEVDVREDGRDESALRRAFLRRKPLPLLHVPGLQELPDQLQEFLVGDPVADEFQHPLVAHAVEEAFDVRLDDMVHRMPHDGLVHFPQRLMAPAPLPEPVRAVEEVRLIDRLQYPRHPALDDFVFHRGDAERAHLPVRFRDVDAPDRLRLIAHPLHPFDKSGKRRVRHFLIFLKCHPVRPGRSPALEPSEALFQVGGAQQVRHVFDTLRSARPRPVR